MTMDPEGFRRLLRAVAEAWNEGDTPAALACFTEDARYTEPPDTQHHEGRQALYEFFGGEDPPPKRMVWHNVVFDEAQQLGAGEYTFIGTNTSHGVVLIRLRDDLIANWREYQYRSDLGWEDFTALNPF